MWVSESVNNFQMQLTDFTKCDVNAVQQLDHGAH